MPRPQSEGKRINKYDKNFLKIMKKKYGADYELHCENEDIIEWPGHTRYTDSFKNLQKKKMIRKFGNKLVNKYKPEFIKFLKENFGFEDHLNNLENRCNILIRQNYPDDLRYSGDYIREKKKSAQRVRRCRERKKSALDISTKDQLSIETIDSGYSDLNDSPNENEFCINMDVTNDLNDISQISMDQLDDLDLLNLIIEDELNSINHYEFDQYSQS